MKRIVMFAEGDPKNQKRFELLYGALMLGGYPESRQTRGMEVIRREARLLDALDSVSTPSADPDAQPMNGERARIVNASGRLVLDQPDFELLKNRVEETPWLPKVARDVVDTVDWLGTAKEQP